MTGATCHHDSKRAAARLRALLGFAGLSAAGRRSYLSSSITEFVQAVDEKISELNGEKQKSAHPPPNPKRGAPFGNRNRQTHGRRTRARRAFYAQVRAFIREGDALVAEAKLLLAVLKLEKAHRIDVDRNPHLLRNLHAREPGAQERLHVDAALGLDQQPLARLPAQQASVTDATSFASRPR